MMNLLLFLSLVPSVQAGGSAWVDISTTALAEAQAAGKPALIEFQAPWCYSCYYMERNVLSKSAFAKAAQGLFLVKADVDKEEGRVFKEKYGVPALPGFVLLDAKGEVQGRISGEQTEADFLARLDVLVKRAFPDPDDEIVLGIQQRLLSGESARAADAISRIPVARRQRLRNRKDWRILEARLALQRGQGEAVIGPLKLLLEIEDSCDLAYDVDRAEKAVDFLREGDKKEVLDAERAALEGLAARKLFDPKAERCADFRTGVATLAGVYDKLGEKALRDDLYKRALGVLDDMGRRVGKDRNRDDNRRFFLERLGDDAALKSLYGELVEAYPSDYVYPYRYARYLIGKGDAAAALEWAEKADKLSYGANRLAVTRVRAQALAALGRKDEAAALLQRDIKAGAAFPEEARRLEEQLSGLGQPPATPAP